MFHQFPDAAVVVEVVVGGIVIWVVVGAGVEVVVGVDVVVDVGVEVNELQAAKTNDVTMRQVSTIQITPLFIRAPFTFLNGKFMKN